MVLCGVANVVLNAVKKRKSLYGKSKRLRNIEIANISKLLYY